jgi:hypothetical protein
VPAGSKRRDRSASGGIRPRQGYHLRVAGSEVTNLIVQPPIRREFQIGSMCSEFFPDLGMVMIGSRNHHTMPRYPFSGHGEPRDGPVVRRGPACPKPPKRTGRGRVQLADSLADAVITIPVIQPPRWREEH